MIRKEERIGGQRLILGDCLEVMPLLGKFDACITDPPFGVGNFVQTTGRLRGRGKNIGKTVEWNEVGPPPEFFELIKDITKHRIIWGANFFNCFEPAGGAIVWNKRQPMPNFSKAEIASCTHFKKTEIVEIPWANFEVGRLAETDHPCERPVSLYEWCIKYLPKPIETILEPFMGSASCIVACQKLGRQGTGIELDPDYFEIACKRVDEATRQPDLFVEPPKPAAKQEGFL